MRRTLALLCAIAPAFALPRRGALAPREPGLLGPILGGLGLGGGGGTCGYTCPPGDLTKGLLIGVTSKAGLLECTYLDLFNENLLCLYSSVRHRVRETGRDADMRSQLDDGPARD
jgi:hypothetical protein